MSTFDAETAGNFEEIEMQFAVKTVEHLEVGLRNTSTVQCAIDRQRRTKSSSRVYHQAS